MPGARALLVLLVCLALALALGACGSEAGGEEGTSATTSEAESEAILEQEADVAALNQVLGRQRAAIGAFDELIAQMRGWPRALAVRLRTQEEEHTLAVLAALRLIEGAEEVEDEEIELTNPDTEAGRLTMLYEIQSATIEDEIGAIARLYSPSARSTLAATVGNHAQQLVLLRRALGAKPAEWLPAPFEDGTTPAP
jgi:hypothetical protein